MEEIQTEIQKMIKEDATASLTEVAIVQNKLE